MNKKEVAKNISNEFGFPIPDSERIVDIVLNSIKEGVIDGELVTIHNFGTFRAVKYDAKTGRNPKTGESIEVPAKTKVKFKPSSNFLNTEK